MKTKDLFRLNINNPTMNLDILLKKTQNFTKIKGITKSDLENAIKRSRS